MKSLLGPKALENLIVDRESGEIIITNDGATAIEYMVRIKVRIAIIIYGFIEI